MSTTVEPISLFTPILDHGIRSVNFFNGRLLTGRDLGREQDARRQADARLGRAGGSGIASGLEVALAGDPKKRAVTVTAGLAVTPAGQTLLLGADQVVALATRLEDAAPTLSGAAFGPCGVLSGGTYAAGGGFYLLTLAPSSADEGKAPVLALDPGNVRCNTDANVEAVQLRLLKIEAGILAVAGLETNVSGAAAVSRLRNALAYACFGFPALADAHRRPGMPAAGGLLDAMRAHGLSNCEVPLAVVYITNSAGIVYVDTWSARRRIAASAAPAWSALVGDSIDAVAEAQLAQFQDQLGAIPDASLSGLSAKEWFAWLPPAGFLDAEGPRAVFWQTFLGHLAPVADVPLSSGNLRGVLAAALTRDPVRVSDLIPYRVYSLTDSSGPSVRVFVRSGTLPAEDVWLQAERAGLPGVEDVQTAIGTLRARTCRQLVLWPQADVHERVGTLRAGENVSLCFEAGRYTLVKPIRLSGLGHVTIHGAGAGSALTASSGECALLVESCLSVAVSDLAVAANQPGPGKDPTGIGQHGALTVLDTPRVHIERVVASCGEGEKPGGAGIVVSNDTAGRGTQGRGSEACIAACSVTVGSNQIGIQCINADMAIVRQNTVVVASEQDSLQRGIVIGGQTATDVRIDSNIVSGAVQGISVGFSQREAVKGKALQVDRAVVTNNSVRLAPAAGDSGGNRFGIFVGNANSVLVQANRIRFFTPSAEGLPARFAWEAIRLTGFYGPHLVVRDNHIEGATTGINFNPRVVEGAAFPGRKACVWLVQFNVAETTTGSERPTAVKVTPAAAASAVIEHNIPEPPQE
jgi:hypothetical protein